MSVPRVLIVCHGHPQLVSGGTETVAHDLLRALPAAGLAETYFLGCVSGLHRDKRESSVLQGIDGAENEMLLRIGPFDPFMLSHLAAPDVHAGFRRVIEHVRPDIVHFHHLNLIGAEAIALARHVRPSARILLTLHDYHPICANDGLMMTRPGANLCHGAGPDACHSCFPETRPSHFALRARHLRNLLGLIDRFIAPSRFARDRFIAWGLPAASIEVIANPVDGEPATSVPAGPRAAFGYFGNIAPHKGVLVALDAIRFLAREHAADDTSPRLIVHGGIQHQGQDFVTAFTRALARATPHAFHAGPYRRTELAELMAAVDWVVVPSLWWENAPLVILEAFRHRRPVIAANIGGMAELVRHGENGLLFRRGDAADLARMMLRAVGEPDLAERLVGRRPPVTTPAEAARRHAEIYRTLLEQSPSLTA
jgi:glycosyltransferase involved in cell wall biosynthesis